MTHQWLRKPKPLGTALVLLSLLFIVACGSASQPDSNQQGAETVSQQLAAQPTPTKFAGAQLIATLTPTTAPAAAGAPSYAQAYRRTTAGHAGAGQVRRLCHHDGL